MMKGRAAIAGTAIAAVALGSSLTWSSTATATMPGSSGLLRQASPSQTGPGAAVTLITGDRAFVTRDAQDRPSATLLPRASADAGGYVTRTVGKDLYLTPAQAIPLIRDHKLDPELFNVTRLVAQGYDDAHLSSIPLLATYSGVALAQGTTQTLGGVKITRTFTSSNLAALSAEKTAAPDFWKALTSPAPRSGSGPAISKVWLDRKEHADLAQSVAQIHAPQALAAGYDGTGTKVAVLDTGYDDKHPDLIGQVVAAKDFTGSGSAVDENGHGTHVASIVAGTGAASHGREKGVAPGTKLLIGRVLDADGFGQESAIIAGMEWAVAEGADVVSMSLGSSVPTDCTDPLGAAVQELSADTKSLFVVAAGNNLTIESIGSPGCAEGALTVGAVDAHDITASFSSRGSVIGDHRLKPDIAAPGVDILAAAMGSPGGNAYVSLSGTSMATPHVAGAAAILAQRQPKWTAQQRKAALISSVAPGAKDNVYAQGGGVVDVRRAISQTVLGPGTTNLGAFAWPHSAKQRTTAEVAFTNLGDRAETFHLSLADVDGQDGKPLSKGTLTLGRTTITVPAQGTALIPVTVDPGVRQANASYGNAGGRIIARGGRHGEKTIVTPVGFWLEPNTVTLTIRTIDRHGQPAGQFSFVDVLGIDGGTGERRFLSGGDEVVRVRAGAVGVFAMIADEEGGTTAPALLRSISYLSNPEIRVDHDMTLIYDARKAVKQQVIGPRPLESQSIFVQYDRSWNNFESSGGIATRLTGVDIYSAASAPIHTGTFEFDVFNRLFAPELHSIESNRGTVLKPVYFDLSAKLDGVDSAGLVDAGDGSAEELARANVAGKVAIVRGGPFDSAGKLAAAAEAGARAVFFDAGSADRWQAQSATPTVPGLAITSAESARLRADLAKGATRISWQAAGNSPYVYNLAFVDKGSVVAGPRHVSDKDLGRVEEDWSMMRNAGYKFDLVQSVRPGVSAISFVGTNVVNAPSHRTAYYSAGDTTWQQLASSVGRFIEVMFAKPRSYRRGEVRSDAWYRGPLTISPTRDGLWTQNHVGERQGNLIGVAFSTWQDANPDHVGDGGFLDGGSAELIANGTSLGARPGSPRGQWVVPEGDVAFTLRAETLRINPESPLNPDWHMSFRTTTSWQFRSTAPALNAVGALPMLLPTYDLALDGTNLAPATPGYQVRFRAVGQRDYKAGPMTSAKAWVSFDDGENWIQAPVTPSHGQFLAQVDNSAVHKGYISLRISVTDSHGSSVDQTIIRAYGIE